MSGFDGLSGHAVERRICIENRQVLISNHDGLRAGVEYLRCLSQFLFYQFAFRDVLDYAYCITRIPRAELASDPVKNIKALLGVRINNFKLYFDALFQLTVQGNYLTVNACSVGLPDQ